MSDTIIRGIQGALVGFYGVLLFTKFAAVRLALREHKLAQTAHREAQAMHREAQDRFAEATRRYREASRLREEAQQLRDEALEDFCGGDDEDVEEWGSN